MITEDQFIVGGKFWYIDPNGVTIPVTIIALPIPNTNMIHLVENLADGGTREFYAGVESFLRVATVRTTADTTPSFGGIVVAVIAAAVIYYLLTR